MKVAQKIRGRIDLLPEGEVFDYGYFDLSAEEFWAGAKALERLTKAGVIKRLEKGLFYKPGKSIFGELGPDDQSIIRRFLYREGKPVAYPSGFGLYNALNLTDQFSFIFHIATTHPQKEKKLGNLKIRTMKAYAKVSTENVYMLGLLDALKDLKRIPGTSTSVALKSMESRIAALSVSERWLMIQLALCYPPRVRALLGAILEAQSEGTDKLVTLKKSLNPSTIYHLGIHAKDLKTVINWNIQ